MKSSTERLKRVETKVLSSMDHERISVFTEHITDNPNCSIADKAEFAKDRNNNRHGVSLQGCHEDPRLRPQCGDPPCGGPDFRPVIEKHVLNVSRLTKKRRHRQAFVDDLLGLPRTDRKVLEIHDHVSGHVPAVRPIRVLKNHKLPVPIEVFDEQWDNGVRI